MILERKLDDNFPKGEFLIKGFTEPDRLDRNYKEGEIMLYFRDAPSKLLYIEKNSI